MQSGIPFHLHLPQLGQQPLTTMLPLPKSSFTIDGEACQVSGRILTVGTAHPGPNPTNACSAWKFFNGGLVLSVVSYCHKNRPSWHARSLQAWLERNQGEIAKKLASIMGTTGGIELPRNEASDISTSLWTDPAGSSVWQTSSNTSQHGGSEIQTVRAPSSLDFR